uniref:Uncharacterized protein n=1 Tax=Leptobrachium leishanense TaxID=445787 RepID=A0A8C5WB91_9ANUR
MASLAKSLFEGPVKSISCCTSAGFQQEHNTTREIPRGMNVMRRWSSEDQYQRRSQPETRRNSFYAQQRAERAAMREHFRGKYNLERVGSSWLRVFIMSCPDRLLTYDCLLTEPERRASRQDSWKQHPNVQRGSWYGESQGAFFRERLHPWLPALS